MTAMNKKIITMVAAMMIGAMAFAADYRLVKVSDRMLDLNSRVVVAFCVNKTDSSKAGVALVHQDDEGGVSIEIDLTTTTPQAMTLFKRYSNMPVQTVDNIIFADWSRNTAAYYYHEEVNGYIVLYNAVDDMLLGVNAR
jgi:hypothetical protein